MFAICFYISNKRGRVQLRHIDCFLSTCIDEKGPYILQSEVEKSNKEIRNRKATGDDDIPGDVLKLLEEDGLKILTKLINTIHETGEWPKDFKELNVYLTVHHELTI